MKKSEPGNPRSLRADGKAIPFHGSAIAAEISGYVDLGMKRQAVRLTRKVLQKRRIRPVEFSEAVRAIGVYGSSFKKWKSKIETAYNRQSKKFKRAVRSDMLDMYAGLGEWQTASQFVDVRRPSNATDFFFGMDVLIELEKFQEAEELARRCEKMLRIEATDFARSLLCCALGQFFARKRHWDWALTAWQHTPPDSSIASNVLSGIVEIHLARALEAVEAGLRLLADRKARQPSELDLCVPKLEFDLAVDAEKHLLKFKRGIEKLLPEQARKQLGMSESPSSEESSETIEGTDANEIHRGPHGP